MLYKMLNFLWSVKQAPEVSAWYRRKKNLIWQNNHPHLGLTNGIIWQMGLLLCRSHLSARFVLLILRCTAQSFFFYISAWAFLPAKIYFVFSYRFHHQRNHLRSDISEWEENLRLISWLPLDIFNDQLGFVKIAFTVLINRETFLGEKTFHGFKVYFGTGNLNYIFLANH